jgi:hypothetical protein
MRQGFALNSWTVEQRGSYWYYGETYRDERDAYRGPYSSLVSVTLMIAREMIREVARRKKRMESAHAGIP